MLAVLLRVFFFVLIARAVLQVWRMVGSAARRPARRGADAPEGPPPPRQRPPLEGKIVDAEFEDLEERKRP